MSHHNPHDDWLHQYNMICRANIANSRANLENSRANRQAVRLLQTQWFPQDQQPHMVQESTDDITVNDVAPFPHEDRPEATYQARLDAYEESVKEIRRENPNDIEATKAKFKRASKQFLLNIKADLETARFNNNVRGRAACRRIEDFYEELFGRDETPVDQSHNDNTQLSPERSFILQNNVDHIQVDQTVPTGSDRMYHPTSNSVLDAFNGQSVQNEGASCYIQTPNSYPLLRIGMDQDLLPVPQMIMAHQSLLQAHQALLRVTHRLAQQDVLLRYNRVVQQNAVHRIQPSSHQDSSSISTQGGHPPSGPYNAAQNGDVISNRAMDVRSRVTAAKVIRAVHQAKQSR